MVDGAFDGEKHLKIVARMGLLLQRMSSELTQECERIGAWGVLGEGTGGKLVNPSSGQPMERHELFGRFPLQVQLFLQCSLSQIIVSSLLRA